jgi:hypothetical protein
LALEFPDLAFPVSPHLNLGERQQAKGRHQENKNPLHSFLLFSLKGQGPAANPHQGVNRICMLKSQANLIVHPPLGVGLIWD